MNWPIWPTGTPKSHVRNHHGGSPQKDGLDQPQVVGGCHHATEEDHYLKSRPRIQAPMVGPDPNLGRFLEVLGVAT